MERKSLGKWKLPQPTDIKEENEWVAIPKISRTIPFGYEVDKKDNGILNPIPDQLDKLEIAKRYLKQYSYREVSQWLTRNTGRYISHVGLRKRLENEKRRNNQAASLRRWADYAKEAIAKAEKIESQRVGSKESYSEEEARTT
jgi:hypothetical protein|tara:strand:+ start:2720 stop:3148 length:429 start_codon:yes stop_codon:yes gene_type:complete